jgi:hypothetical protein
MKIGICILAVCCMILSLSCKKHYYYYFNIKNASQKSILYSYSTRYPDTSIAYIDDPKIIVPGETYAVLTNIKYDANSPYTGIIELFVFDRDTLNAYKWDTITAKYRVRRYDLTVDSLHKMNSTVTYP